MTPKDRDRLLKFCRLLASDQDGERGTAASMANRLAEQLGGWDKVIAGASQPEQDRPGAKHWTGPNPSHTRDDWADAWGTTRRDYRDEMRQHEAWVRQQAEAFKREMAKNAERQREEAERAKRQAQNARAAQNMNADQWNADDLEKMKQKVERRMRQAGMWKDLP